ncbi:MAG: hypothetical protein ABIS50_11480 [Luteolibacter sp.]|uniref:hypothetical protein n=1 Tax=Luteolibacter sp. TaxID=1962973 RepID=UPI0032634162
MMANLANAYLLWLGCTLMAGMVCGCGFILLIMQGSRNYDATDRTRRTFTKQRK